MLWRTVDVSATTFTSMPPLVIEVVLQVRDLTPNQSLVLLGEGGKRWDVDGGRGQKKLKSGEIVLERWTVDWLLPSATEAPELPVTYKKSIVVFRTLYTLARLLPAWKLRKKLTKSKLTGNTLKIACRVLQGKSSDSNDSRIALSQPLVRGHEEMLGSKSFHAVETLAGRLQISVEFRTTCDLRIDDSEALLSSLFITSDRGLQAYTSSSSSLESARLRVHRQVSTTTTDPTQRQSNNSLPSNLNEGRLPGGLSGARNERRPSAALIQPFKTPSLSASPSLEHYSGSPRYLPRTPSSASIDRLSARHAIYQPPQRIPGSNQASSESLTTNSPRLVGQAPSLVKRYSSSFGQRSGSFSSRRRISTTSDSACLPDVKSPGSVQFSKGTPSGQAAISEDELGDFVKMLDNRQPLLGQHFKDDLTSSSRVLADSMLQRTDSELTRYQRLRESHTAITDSLLHSALYKPEALPPTSGRRCSAQFGVVHGQSQSPGKPMSPHTPAIPSRLSESSVMPRPDMTHELEPRGQLDSPDIVKASHGAVDIPPPPSPYVAPRSSSFKEYNRSAHHQPLPSQSGTSLDSLTRSGSRSCNQEIGNVSRDRDTPSRPGCIPLQVSGSTVNSTQISTTMDLTQPGQSSGPDGSRHASDPAQTPTVAQPSTLVPTTGEDDELFFAMSDIHLGRNT